MADLPDRFPSVFTSSMLADLHSCSQKFYTTYIHRLVPENESIHLIAGDCFAHGLQRAREAYYMEQAPSDEALQKGIVKLLSRWTFPDSMSHTKKPLDRVVGALEAYLSTYPFDSDGLVPALLAERQAIEFTFTIPLPVLHPDSGEPIIYQGRCDMIGTYNSSIFTVDEKTTTQLGETWSSNFRLRGQFIGYTWAALEYGIPVIGTFVRGVAIRKTGYDFAQTSHIYRSHTLKEWLESACNKIEEAKEKWARSYWPKVFADACTSYGGCAFLDRCSSLHPDRIPGFRQVEKLYFEREGEEKIW